MNDRMSYMTLGGRRRDIIALNVHSPTKNKTEDKKDSFCEDVNLYSINSLKEEYRVRMF
jgi:hypothetical protein